jgi:hypothetical protein
MHSPTPRRRPGRPVPEAPLETLAGDAERLAKGWLVAMIEERPLSEVPGILRGEWGTDAPRLCAAAVRALASDEALARLDPADGSLDALRAVLWSALRAAWPDAAADQVWDLGERLALVIETLRRAGRGWPRALEEGIARARGAEGTLAVVLAELVDYDRMLAVESPEDCATVVSRFREAVRGAMAGTGRAVDDGDARAWAIAPDAGRPEAVALGARIAEAVREAPSWRGAPLVAAVGVAMLGEDGEDAESLINAAEEAMFRSAAEA